MVHADAASRGSDAPAAAAGPAAQPADQEAQAAEKLATEEIDDDDSNESCGFCRFMKGGGCRAAFMAWSQCVDKEREAGADYTETCTQQTIALRECMLKHQDYYKVLLDEEEEMAREQQVAASTPDGEPLQAAQHDQ